MVSGVQVLVEDGSSLVEKRLVVSVAVTQAIIFAFLIYFKRVNKIV